MNVEQIGQLIKCVVTYFIPIASFILSIYSIYRSSKVSALEQKVNEYDLKLVDQMSQSKNGKGQ